MVRAFERAGKDLGATTVADIRHPLGASDYSAFLPRIKSLNPDILVLANFGRDLANSAMQCTDFGLKASMKIVAPVLLYTSRVSAGPDAFEGIAGGTSYYWGLEDRIPSAKVFNDAYRKAYSGAVPSDYGALGYAGVKSVLAAVLAAKSVDTEKVITAMQALKYDWYKGPESYRACDHQAEQSVIIVESKSKDMKDKNDVFKILSVEESAEKNMRSCTELGFK